MRGRDRGREVARNSDMKFFAHIICTPTKAAVTAAERKIQICEVFFEPIVEMTASIVVYNSFAFGTVYCAAEKRSNFCRRTVRRNRARIFIEIAFVFVVAGGQSIEIGVYNVPFFYFTLAYIKIVVVKSVALVVPRYVRINAGGSIHPHHVPGVCDLNSGGVQAPACDSPGFYARFLQKKLVCGGIAGTNGFAGHERAVCCLMFAGRFIRYLFCKGIVEIQRFYICIALGHTGKYSGNGIVKGFFCCFQCFALERIARGNGNYSFGCSV